MSGPRPREKNCSLWRKMSVPYELLRNRAVVAVADTYNVRNGESKDCEDKIPGARGAAIVHGQLLRSS